MVQELRIYKDKYNIPYHEVVREYNTKDKIYNFSGAVSCIEECFLPAKEINENMYLIMLNNANTIIGVSKIATFDRVRSLCPINIILQYSLYFGAVHIIVAHNHPSNANISKDDLKATKQLQSACKLVELNLLDSICFKEEPESILDLVKEK